eukprot:CAMPEP_0206618404 /NCGR_PEP_ID=MMETSP0325_2-20121206/60228_1 /ASSEMBLY_ACC=CAM_ASM_000347 /TAXON_ID=2866 /ORGANISM="Crypthecodinium cohnii, Strain Seligo" /LENGTH=146 /DNA_ID=CAMNT_0054140607 /DNA_START=1 /DNA_END=442 /DNA_ORIENTATION=-
MLEGLREGKGGINDLSTWGDTFKRVLEECDAWLAAEEAPAGKSGKLSPPQSQRAESETSQKDQKVLGELEQAQNAAQVQSEESSDEEPAENLPGWDRLWRAQAMHADLQENTQEEQRTGAVAEALIAAAVNPDELAQMYEGWTSWI